MKQRYNENIKKDIIKDIQKYSKDQVLTYKFLNDEYHDHHLIYSLETIRVNFGSIKNACEEAGYQYGKEKDFMRAKIIKCMKEWPECKRIDTKSLEAFHKEGKLPSLDTIFRIFKTFKELCKACNLPYNSLKPKVFSLEEINNNLVMIFKRDGPFPKRFIDTKYKEFFPGSTQIRVRTKMQLDDWANSNGVYFKYIGGNPQSNGINEELLINKLREFYDGIIDTESPETTVEYNVIENGKQIKKTCYVDGIDRKAKIIWEIYEWWHGEKVKRKKDEDKVIWLIKDECDVRIYWEDALFEIYPELIPFRKYNVKNNKKRKKIYC